MKCFRLTESKYCNKVDLLSGRGAGEGGGRWNRVGTPVAYLGETAEVAIVEKGFYTISQFVGLANEQFVPGRKTQEYFTDQAKSVSLSLATLEVSDSLSILDLTDDHIWKQINERAGIGPYSIQDSRKSPYELLPGRWTQQLSHYIEHNTTAVGIHVASARHAEGKATVLFSRKIDHELVDLISIEDVVLRGPKMNGREKLSPANVLAIEVEYQGSSRNLNICEFPI